MHPRIGITSTPGTHASTALGIERPLASLDVAYVEAVAMAGGAPLLLPTVDEALVPRVLDGLDAVILSGGGDVDPARYGAEPDPETGGVHEGRDAFELAIVHEARERDLPVLAICRGLQVLNVALGGTLHQHVPRITHHRHKDPDNWDVSASPVTVEEGTRLHGIVGGTQITVNSLHHQSADRLGEGLRCVAVDGDDIVEAIEPTDDSAVLGVQWHPELLTGEPVHAALFHWLVNRALERRGETLAR